MSFRPAGLGIESDPMRNQPPSKNRSRRLPLLTTSAVGLSVALAAFAAPARGADPVAAENKALRDQNRELQTRLAAAAADQKKEAAPQAAAAEALERGAGGQVNL